MTAISTTRHPQRALLVAALCASLHAGCSLLVDFDECTSAADCKPDPNANVACQDKVCVSTPLVLEGATCTIPARSKAAAPDAIRVGFIMPLSGDDGAYGQAILRSVELAIEEFNSVGGVRGRPIGLITCDSQAKEDLALAAARHLAAARVSAIIGPDYSSHTLAVANEVTIPNKIFLISPAATSALISELDDEDLVWRTIISDLIQGEALAKLTSDLIAKSAAPNTTKITILLPEGDTYSSGLAEILLSGLPQRYQSSNKDLISVIRYPNASAGMSNIYASTITALSNEAVKPRIIVLLGATESWELIRGVEMILPDLKPIYVMPDAPKNEDAARRQLPNPSADLRARILGTVAKTPDQSYPPYNAFAIRFLLKYPTITPNASSVAQGYDAAYLVGLAIAAGGPSGKDIARGMRKLSDPNAMRFIADTTKLPAVLADLTKGRSINYEGASGPLDFNAKGDPSTGAVAIWCLEQDGSLTEQTLPLLDESGAFTPRSCAPTMMPPDDMGMDMGQDMASDDMDMAPDMTGD
jgi:branched-chain amino acid transport system substrate-binding protein